MVPKDSTRFAINLQRGADPEHADLHLHLCAHLGGTPVVVRNSRLRGDWGVEERLDGPFPFPVAPRTFLLVITAYMDSYEVEINGSSNFSFKVRDGLPISSVTHLAIEAGLFIRAIHAPVESMPRKLRLSLGSGVKVGDMFSIKGEPTEDAKSFVVNWQTGPGKFDDVLFLLNPQLEEDRVVMNCRLDDEWAKEETSSDCPFSPGKPFHLAVGVSSLGFDTLLDGKEWLNFRHKHEVSNAKTLFIEGDLQPTDIWIDCAQLNASGIVNGVIKRGVRLQLICPELPLTSRITGGFEKGCLFLISGRINTQPLKLQMNVQCGEGSEDCDIALCFDVLWKDDTPKITLNSREENSWGQEVSATVVEGLAAGRPFDLLVARTEDRFQCFLDGLELAHLPYRVEDPLPDHITLSGDLETYRLLLL
ncbi:32 kDa beta-galactoside-binding lectin-like isoform X1 [Stegodyphus dumicola]|uniref:32 kDa beta-galactoside-binding lectin-like isoform X1 n=2 Tax=Stegodyphus dumicola TaxID=202533 RepID=UPI0015B26CC6|nr:32 kDa beta-galactoside-binding lectin-like isoform X1 [Stegodyphus dumicola]